MHLTHRPKFSLGDVPIYNVIAGYTAKINNIIMLT